ncbi:DUF7342 family protein [Haloarcula brevis]|uniref:DUF7342 family protein n=1 Tax=Haloarcula brevis TaxID=3111453 RepID=UPI00300EA299
MHGRLGCRERPATRRFHLRVRCSGRDQRAGRPAGPGGETTRYQPDYTRLLFEEIRTLIEENAREELRNELAAITEEIEEWQATYDVETWEALEQSLAEGALASGELRDRRDVITRWEENLGDRRLIKHALALYSDVEAAREQRINVADRVRN